MQTPSRSDRARRTTALALGLLVSLTSAAHESDGDAVPDLRGWSLGAGLAVQAVAEGDAWPLAQRDGVLLTGERNRDRSGQ
ncbi:MAG: hypothetical protein J0M20_13470, partial [Burkholderiales bacterium]|nr:hypothetical protein [Burkholderiales bacterium]